MERNQLWNRLLGHERDNGGLSNSRWGFVGQDQKEEKAHHHVVYSDGGMDDYLAGLDI